MKISSIHEIHIRLLRIGTCPSLSGRSTLTYQIGFNAESEICIRISNNSGRGQFNAIWVELKVIEKLLNEHPVDKPIMGSRVLLPVFKNRSSNSSAFYLSAILAEGLVKAGTEKDSGYLIGDFEAFRQSLAALITSGTDLSTPAIASSDPVKKKRPTKESE